MKSLLSTWGIEAFTAAANASVRRQIDATFAAGRSISVIESGKVVQLSQVEQLQRQLEVEAGSKPSSPPEVGDPASDPVGARE